MSLCAPTRFTKIDPLSRDPFFASIQQQDPSLSLLPDSVHSTLNRYLPYPLPHQVPPRLSPRRSRTRLRLPRRRIGRGD
jgi:hypothetical protein